MNKYTIDHNGKQYKRINKTAAVNAYMQGKTIFVCACKLHPFNMYMPACTVNRKNRAHLVLDEIGARNDFYNWLASFEFYNCNYNQCGKYPAFYIEK